MSTVNSKTLQYGLKPSASKAGLSFGLPLAKSCPDVIVAPLISSPNILGV